ncbi:winged helix-turn-helix transcriptional regulator [bacterium]|nr:winged helix-turn-helix transcriptional regulator [bacterium]
MNEALRRFKAEFFKALAHPLRIAILDALREGERGVNELAEHLGAEPTTLSQQLAVLRARNLVTGRKEGSFVLYSVKDPAIFTLLDDARVIFNNHLVEIRDTLESLEPAP